MGIKNVPRILDDCGLLQYEFTNLRPWIQRHKNTNADLYLAGIYGFFTDSDSVLDINALGATPQLIYDDSTVESFGSLVTHEALELRKIIIDEEYGYRYNENSAYSLGKLLQAIIVHEFGHHLGLTNQAHNEDTHSSIWCIMNLSWHPQDAFDPLNPARGTFNNPHFCDNHLLEISP